jgi:Fe-S cluster assembly protein SufD
MITHIKNKVTHLTQLAPVMITHPGEYVYFFHNLSGELDISITGEGVKVYIFGLYTGKESKTYTLRTIQRHRAPGSWSELLIKGVFDDRSSLDYSGLIRIEKECNGSHAYQKNQNILLSRHTHVSSEPNLEILSPDVFCTHGSTTGKPSEDILAYIQARGVSRPDALQLYTDGFIAEMYERICSFDPKFEIPSETV